MANRRVGLWLIGALGSVGATVALGLAALKRGLSDRTGLVTALDGFRSVDFDEPCEFALGGWDIRQGDLLSSASAVGGARPAFPAAIIDACKPELTHWSANIRAGCLLNCDTVAGKLADRSDLPRGESIRTAIDRLQDDLNSFAQREELDQVVVINVASTEPPAPAAVSRCVLPQLNQLITANDSTMLPTSAWYAYAAIEAGHGYVNFTPSTGAELPAILELARQRKVPIAGSDGKTGETLLKTVLAPMFLQRNLKVLSWVGHNILGNRDGRVLIDPANRASKLRSKDQVVASILGYAPETLTTIDFVESLDDWKTAWDHIHFQGFLGVPMALQVTWQGCDSALAAPLVIDLARLILAAQRCGVEGVCADLAVFFKSPMGSSDHDLSRQFLRLQEFAKTLGAK